MPENFRDGLWHRVAWPLACPSIGDVGHWGGVTVHSEVGVLHSLRWIIACAPAFPPFCVPHLGSPLLENALFTYLANSPTHPQACTAWAGSFLSVSPAPKKLGGRGLGWGRSLGSDSWNLSECTGRGHSKAQRFSFRTSCIWNGLHIRPGFSHNHTHNIATYLKNLRHNLQLNGNKGFVSLVSEL